MVINKVEEAKEFYKVKENWDDDDLPSYYSTNQKNGLGFTVKFFLFSFLIFILAAVFAWYSFYNNNSSFSQNKIDFFINAPVSVDSGSDAEIDFSITNKNTTALSDAYIMVTYNSGETSSGNKNLITQKIDLGEVLSNTSINKSISASLFGNEGDSKEINSVLFYKVTSSKAEFNRAGTPISVLIKSSPVSISVDSLKEVHQNNNFEFVLTISNNTNNIINNLLVAVRAPKDFVYASSSQATYNSNPSWMLPKLSPGQKQVITFSGKLTGPIGEASTFTFLAGLPKKSSDTKNSTTTLNNFDNYNLSLDNIYSKVEKTIFIAGQYLDVDITSDGTSGSGAVSANDLMYLEFTYKNNLALPLDNLVLIAKLSGDAIDINSIAPDLGYYDSNNSIVVWDKNSMPDLSKVPANGTGKFKLKFRVARDAPPGSKIRIQVFGKGDRTSETGVSNEQDLSIDRAWVVN
ncbi:MAG: hypothetical protein QG630_114 [Patescibacteria group bacterium]|nr:hypothetical protein [Patescibacteria group bacterium]